MKALSMLAAKISHGGLFARKFCADGTRTLWRNHTGNLEAAALVLFRGAPQQLTVVAFLPKNGRYRPSRRLIAYSATTADRERRT
jgi:hypothetical protein